MRPNAFVNYTFFMMWPSNVLSNLDSIEGRIDRDQRQSCALNVAPQLVQAAKGYGGSRHQNERQHSNPTDRSRLGSRVAGGFCCRRASLGRGERGTRESP